MNNRLVTLYILFILLAGCASTGSVPTSSETSQEFPSLDAGEGRIFFYRKARYAGFVIQPSVDLNDEKVGRAIPGSYFFVDRPSGRYTVQVSKEKEITFELLSGEEKYVYMSIAWDNDGRIFHTITPTLVHPDMGKAAIRVLSYSGNN